jgi:hypothetical protein
MSFGGQTPTIIVLKEGEWKARQIFEGKGICADPATHI